MKTLRRKVYMVAGYSSISMVFRQERIQPGKKPCQVSKITSGKPDREPEKDRGCTNVYECVIGNFMAARYNKQAHLGAFFPYVDEGLRGKPAVSVEGACASVLLAWFQE